jgi:tRNA dimethylallyltransferase
MGPTASGKTSLAIELTQHLPCDIISVDSAMVYRGMDIGTAKPTPAECAVAPHQLIDIADPATPYSAGQFCTDATTAIEKTLAKGRMPLLVGGTMLYFRALQQGLSPLPQADTAIRQKIVEEAIESGWAALHQRLHRIDPISAERISPEDSQRIQRALEIYEITGCSLTEFCQQSKAQPTPYSMINIGLTVENRAHLAQRIEARFKEMLRQGFVAEVENLKARGDLHQDMPSMRAVGYRQVWDYLAGNLNASDMQERAIIATRQLAKRQMTWLRAWPEMTSFEAEQSSLVEKVLKMLTPLF